MAYTGHAAAIFHIACPANATANLPGYGVIFSNLESVPDWNERLQRNIPSLADQKATNVVAISDCAERWSGLGSATGGRPSNLALIAG